MKTIKAKIRGVGLGILLHNPAGMGQSNGKKVIPTPEQEAAAGCYWTEDKTSVAIPSWNLFRALVKAAAAYKDGKTSMSRVIAGSVSAEPLLESLSDIDLGGIHWLIVGGGVGLRPSRHERGVGARTSRPLPRFRGGFPFQAAFGVPSRHRPPVGRGEVSRIAVGADQSQWHA